MSDASPMEGGGSGQALEKAKRVRQADQSIRS
jgi:hypothetical protein